MKKLLALLLALVTMFSVFSLSACGDKEEEVDTGVVTNFVFNGFENFDKDFLTMRVVDWSFGSVHQNFDKKYVKFGESSALFRPIGEIGYTGLPIIYLPLYSNRFEYDYKDMSKVEKISAWYYNAEEETYRVGIGFQTTQIENGQTLDSAGRTVTKKFDLVPGWNYVEYELDPKYLESNSALDLTNVLGICLQFEYRNQMTDVAPYIYVDDIRFHVSETTVQGSSSFGLKADAEKGVWEIADFEDERQLQLFQVSGSYAENRRNTLEIVNANELSTTAKSGSNVLKITRHASYTTSHSYGFALSKDVLIEVFNTIGDDFIENPHNYALKIDYYNYSPIRLRSGYGFGSSCCTRNGPTWRYLDYIDPYTWGEFEIDVGWCDEYIYGHLTDPNPKSTYPRLLDGYTLEDAKFTTNPSNFTFTLPAYPTGDRRDVVFVLDNIGIERVA